MIWDGTGLGVLGFGSWVSPLKTQELKVLSAGPLAATSWARFTRRFMGS